MLCQHQLDTNIEMHQTAEPKIKNKPSKQQKKNDALYIREQNGIKKWILIRIHGSQKKVGKCLYSTERWKNDLAKVSFKDEDKIKTIPDKRDFVSSRPRL